MKKEYDEQKRNKISKEMFQRVNSYFAELDRKHPKMNVKSNPTVCDEKEIRYTEYAKQNLVRVEQYGHALFSEWIPRDDAEGLEIHDPVEWLKDRVKRKEKRIGLGRI